MYIYTLQFAAEHMGISSLDDYRKVVRSLYNPVVMQEKCDKQIIQLLNPTPSAQEINIDIVQMSERN